MPLSPFNINYDRAASRKPVQSFDDLVGARGEAAIGRARGL
jgi:hypothetical protein